MKKENSAHLVPVKKIFLPLTVLLTVITIILLRPAFNSGEPLILPSLFSSLPQEKVLGLTIQTDLGTLLENKALDSYQPALVSWESEDGNPNSYGIQIKVRGKTRRNFCSFPPLKLKFAKKDLKDNGLAPYCTLKLVTHCRENKELVLKEYLAYKLYGMLTDWSFKVQLARVSYIDTAGELDAVEQYAIILENKKELADRLDADLIKGKQTALRCIDAEQYQLLTFFQYMIGNTDWNMSKRHNIKLIQKKGKLTPVPVPYDFDCAGIVNAPYAMPHPQLPIKNVKQRLFQWRGKNMDGFEKTLVYFIGKEKELLDFTRNFNALDEQSKTEVLSYLGSFFEIIKQPGQLQKKIVVANERISA